MFFFLSVNWNLKRCHLHRFSLWMCCWRITNLIEENNPRNGYIDHVTKIDTQFCCAVNNNFHFEAESWAESNRASNMILTLLTWDYGILIYLPRSLSLCYLKFFLFFFCCYWYQQFQTVWFLILSLEHSSESILILNEMRM